MVQNEREDTLLSDEKGGKYLRLKTKIMYESQWQYKQSITFHNKGGESTSRFNLGVAAIQFKSCLECYEESVLKL